MSLIVISVSSCKSPAPKLPYPVIYQPIIKQLFCNEEEDDCEIKTLCREYRYNGQEYEYSRSYDLKKCHGTFALPVKDFLKVKQFIEDMELWVGRNCEIDKEF